METDLAILFRYWKPLEHEMLKLTALCLKVLLIIRIKVMVIFFK